jgi:hypothetical protein
LGVRIILSRVLGVKSPQNTQFLAVIGNSHYKVAKRQTAILLNQSTELNEIFRIHDPRDRKLKNFGNRKLKSKFKMATAAILKIDKRL